MEECGELGEKRVGVRAGGGGGGKRGILLLMSRNGHERQLFFNFCPYQ